ncbi:hypothetical protein [Streptomyces sp. NPDC014623]|uniref:hypothetical protein n=1 Tax=Streptomyces sp. NPDC014623 TaxID=3364875 RepID=UPI0036F81703
MRYPFLAGAAVALATAVLAACDSSDGSGAGGGKPAAAGGTASAAASPAPSAAGPAASPRAAGPGAVPKAPAGEITPATGSFTKKQKEYLTGRVPSGTDPAAVLQTGQETCDRLRYLVKTDRDIAVGAVVSGEVAGAEPAAAHLCPQHQDIVEEAAHGYADGTHGAAAVRPGKYRAPSPTRACGWQLTGANGEELASGSSGTGEQVEITVPESARTFTSTGCYAWLPQGDNR